MSDTERTWWQGVDDTSAFSPLPGPAETSGYAMAALVIAVANWLVPFVIIGPVVALAYARKARRHAERTGRPGAEMARAARLIAGWLLMLQVCALAAAIAIGIGLGYDLTRLPWG